jgi:hypothetical protein
MKVIFCLPGHTYSREFLLAWTEMLMQASARGHQIMVAQNMTRQSCVAGDPSKGPFQDQDYDAALFIGQDTVFKSEDFFNILDSPHNVTAGIYMSETLQNFDVIRENNPDFPQGKYLRPEDIVGTSQYLPVAYAGMNWMLVRKGVFEKLQYPYIWSTQTEPSDEKNFCGLLATVGELIHIDTKMRIGNQKRMIL